MALARDENNIPPLPPPSILPRGWDAVLLNDDFREGLTGWHTQTGSYPPGLSDHTFNRSNHAMKLGTGTTRLGTVGSENSIYRRTYETFSDGYIMLAAWIAYRGTSEQASPAQMAIGIDHQSYDETRRAFGKLRLLRHTVAGDNFAPQWTLNTDQGPAGETGQYIAIPNSGAAQDPPVSGAGSVPGWNYNHAGYSFAALIMSCNDSDNATPGVGFGRYWRAVLGNEIFDLSNLKTNHAMTGPGSGSQPPQTTVDAGSFSGGLNYGFDVINRSTVDDGPAALYVGHAFAVHYPVGTVFPTGA